MRTRLALALFSASLVFVGAGCAAQTQVDADLNGDVMTNTTPEQYPSDETSDSGADAAATMKASGDIDATISLIEADIAAEHETQAAADVTDEDLAADEAELKTLGETSYELQ